MVLARGYRKNHAKPFGPDLKVKQMLERPCGQRRRNYNIKRKHDAEKSLSNNRYSK
jgi:hypothetical protein